MKLFLLNEGKVKNSLINKWLNEVPIQTAIMIDEIKNKRFRFVKLKLWHTILEILKKRY